MTRNKIIIVVLTIALVAASLGLLLSSSKTTTNDQRLTTNTVHYSTLMGKEFYDNAYEEMPKTNNSKLTTNNSVAGGTVNHHLLAAPLDAQFFEGLAAQQPKLIILIGPDHLSRGRAPTTTTAGTWRTPYGDLTTDISLIDELSNKKLVNVEERPFDYEFSVGGLVPFVKRSLPQAKIVTIILGSNATDAQLDQLAAALPRDNGTIVVASNDFSHYLPSRAAEFHDLTNRSIINAFDYSHFKNLEIDSLPTQRLLMKYLELRGAYSATLIVETDSAKITGQSDAPETTSYLNQYFSVGNTTPFKVATSLYLGNIKKIISPEDRFMRGFMTVDDGTTLPPEIKKPDLAVGIARYADRTVYYLFPTIADKTGTRLMTAAEEKAYFRQNKLSESIITEKN